MAKFYWLRENKAARPGGEIDAVSRWLLPGLRDCPTCGTTWSSTGHEYPCVDLSSLEGQGDFETPRPESFEEFARLRELVRPLAPSGALLPPGTEFGPLVGTAQGDFGPIHWLEPWTLLVRREVLERWQATGVRRLQGCSTQLRFRSKANAPELLELQIEPRGLLHPDCLPPTRQPTCARCGRDGFSRPEPPILDAASLPEDRDLFRLANFATMLIGTEQLRAAVERLDSKHILFHELPLR